MLEPSNQGESFAVQDAEQEEEVSFSHLDQDDQFAGLSRNSDDNELEFREGYGDEI